MVRFQSLSYRQQYNTLSFSEGLLANFQHTLAPNYIPQTPARHMPCAPSQREIMSRASDHYFWPSSSPALAGVASAGALAAPAGAGAPGCYLEAMAAGGSAKKPEEKKEPVVEERDHEACFGQSTYKYCGKLMKDHGDAVWCWKKTSWAGALPGTLLCNH